MERINSSNSYCMISIVIVNFNVANLVINCVQSIRRTVTSFMYEIIIVDNGSNKKDILIIKDTLQNITLIENKKNLGFSKAINIGAEKAGGDYLMILNPDTIFIEDIFSKIIPFMEQSENVGLCGPKLIFPDDRKQQSYQKFPTITFFIFQLLYLNRLIKKNKIVKDYYYNFEEYYNTRKVDDILGAAMILKKNFFFDIGGMDEDYFMYFEDTDLCKRVNQNYRDVIYFPESQIVHIHGQSSIKTNVRQFDYYKSMLVYSRKHFGHYSSFIIRLFILLSQLILPFGLFYKYVIKRSDINNFKIKMKTAWDLIKWSICHDTIK